MKKNRTNIIYNDEFRMIRNKPEVTHCLLAAEVKFLGVPERETDRTNKCYDPRKMK